MGLQHDEASPHFGPKGTQHLNRRSGNCRIGLGGSHVWTPRSPDLTRSVVIHERLLYQE